MKKTDMLAYKEKLHAIRARLRGDVSTMAEVALRKSGIEGSDSNASELQATLSEQLAEWGASLASDSLPASM